MRLRSLIIALLLAPAAFGQVASPPLPKDYHVELRYRIDSDRDGRVRLYRAMMAELKAIDFTVDEKEDSDLDILDPSADRLSGTIPSTNLEKLLKVQSVTTVLVWPTTNGLPQVITTPVQISLRIASGLDADTQRLLHEQVIERLTKLGFTSAVGYDDDHFTRVRGSIASGKVLSLLKDLRGLPAGTLLQETPREKLPQPIRSILPVRLIEVLPDLEAIAPAPAVPAASPKYTADLRSTLAAGAKALRVEASLVEAIGDQQAYRVYLKAKHPGINLEGIVGPLVTYSVASPKDLEKFAAEPSVLALRLPPLASNTVKAAERSGGDALGTANIIELQSRGYKGTGRTIVVLAGHFNLVQAPKNAVYFDLTPELSPSLEPLPSNAAFDGTAAALAAHASAPGAKIIMVRVEPSAFHQLHTVARAALGDLTLSPAQVSRAETMLLEYDAINLRRDFVTKEYTDAMTDLRDDDRPRERREKAKAAFNQFRIEELSFTAKYNRMEALRKGLESIRGAVAIANTLTWDDGYPADGLSEFARFLDEKFTPVTRRNAAVASTPTWVQAASESAWSVWAGPAIDRDGNRTLEFADTSVAMPRGLWTRELNFLASVAGNGTVSTDLPAGAKIRIAIQWREPHDPNVALTSEPLIGFTLQLLRQYDPSGEKVRSDEFALTAQTEGPPVRLMLTNAAGVYEQSMEVTVPSAGRYALRVEMDAGSTNRFSASTQIAEISPKIVVRPLGETNDRVIFASYLATRPGVGVPGDSAAAFTVGRCDAKGRSLSLLGAGPGLQLRNKPDALLFGDNALGSGSGVSAGTIAGLAADLADIGVRPLQFVGTQAISPNGMLRLPSEWIQQLPPKR